MRVNYKAVGSFYPGKSTPDTRCGKPGTPVGPIHMQPQLVSSTHIGYIIEVIDDARVGGPSRCYDGEHAVCSGYGPLQCITGQMSPEINLNFKDIYVEDPGSRPDG